MDCSACAVPSPTRALAANALLPLSSALPRVLTYNVGSAGRLFGLLIQPGAEDDDVADLKNLKGVSEQDRRMIADAEALLGPEPSSMGFVKNLFWGHLRQELVFPYPQVSADEKKVCDDLLARLDAYLRN